MSSARRRGWKRVFGSVLAVYLFVALVACTPNAHQGAAPGGSIPGTPAGAATPSAGATRGPLASLRWPAGAIRAGDLLHDDGTSLWAYRLSGKRRLIWRHPAATAGFAAGPNGKQLAMVISRNVTDATQPSSFLYFLGADGSIALVDETFGFTTIESAVFLRDATDPSGPARLIWIRAGEEISTTTGRLAAQVMVDDGGRAVPVSFPLRLGESAFEIEGYPGGTGFTVKLYRHVDVPAQYEVVKNAGTTSVSGPTRWGEFESRGFTDSNLGVVWLSPTEYVVPVADADHPQNVTLRVFDANCAPAGSRVGYRGTAFDAATVDGQWTGPLLPMGAHRVLALTRADFRAARDGHVFWVAVDLRTGRLAHVRVPWSRGSWTAVLPARRPIRTAAFC